MSNPAQDPSGTARTQSETSIAFNPTTGTLCAAWNDSYHGVTQGVGFSGFGRSTDGGATWTDYGAVAPSGNFDTGDPSLVWRKVDGKFYYAALKGGGSGVYRSDDDCQSFTFVANIATGSDDKEIMAVDNNIGSTYYGRLYVVWTDFGAGGQIFSTYSTNAGATWSAQVALTTGQDVQGAWPAASRRTATSSSPGYAGIPGPAATSTLPPAAGALPAAAGAARGDRPLHRRSGARAGGDPLDVLTVRW